MGWLKKVGKKLKKIDSKINDKLSPYHRYANNKYEAEVNQMEKDYRRQSGEQEMTLKKNTASSARIDVQDELEQELEGGGSGKLGTGKTSVRI